MRHSSEYEDDNAPVYSCEDGNWACGKKSYCSTSSRLFTLAATVGKKVAASTSAASVSSLVTVSSQSVSIVTATPSGSGPTSDTSFMTAVSVPTTSTTPIPTPESQPLLSTAAKAGIGAGIAVFALLLGIILFLLHKIKKNKKAQKAYAKAELPGQSAPAVGKPEVTVYA